MFLRCDRICLFGSGKLGMWSGEPFVCHIQVDKFNFVVVVVVVLSSSFLLLKSSCSVQGTTSAAHLQKHFATMNRFAAARRYCEIMTPPDESSFQWAKKKEEKREKANTAASKQQDRRVTPCICWSGFSHPLLKLRRSFMVVPKNLKTDWSFVRCVKQQFRTKIPAFPAKCKVTFFRSTTRWNCQSLKSVLAWLLHRYLALGRNMKLPLSLHLHLLW